MSTSTLQNENLLERTYEDIPESTSAVVETAKKAPRMRKTLIMLIPVRVLTMLLVFP